MLSIADGRSSFWQYDTNRRLACSSEIKYVQFETEGDSAITVKVVGGYVTVPQTLLDGIGKIVAYGVSLDDVGNFIYEKCVFRVMSRQNPDITVTSDTTIQVGDSTVTLIDAIESAKKSMEWATKDGVVEDGLKSSKGYALESKGYKEQANNEYLKAKKIADDLDTHVGVTGNGTVVANINTYIDSTVKPNIVEYVNSKKGALDSKCDDLQAVLVSDKNSITDYLRTYALGNTNSLKSSLVSTFTDKKEELGEYEEELEGSLGDYFSGVKEEFEATIEVDDYKSALSQKKDELEEELKNYTKVGNSSLFKSLESKTTDLKAELLKYALEDIDNDFTSLKEDLIADMTEYVGYTTDVGNVANPDSSETLVGKMNAVNSKLTTEFNSNFTTKRNNILTEGSTQVSAVTEEGTTQKGLVTAEGTSQKTAVKSAGDTEVARVQEIYQTDLGAIASECNEKFGQNPASELKGDDLLEAIEGFTVGLTNFVAQFEQAPTEESTANLVTAIEEHTIALGGAVKYLMEREAQ